MVSCFVGLPGSGKSTLLSYLSFLAIQGKKINRRGFHISSCDSYNHVFTNFPLNGAFKLDFDMLGVSAYEDSMIFCDEIQLFADSRNFKTFADNLSLWFTLHRHFRCDFCYCTQDFSFVDKRIRSITDRIYTIEMLPFSIIRVREWLSVLNSDLGQKLVPASGLNCSYFFAPRLYKYNDTYNIPKDVIFKPTPLVPWFGSADEKKDTLSSEQEKCCTKEVS